jgi:hypothetical protein
LPTRTFVDGTHGGGTGPREVPNIPAHNGVAAPAVAPAAAISRNVRRVIELLMTNSFRWIDSDLISSAAAV